MKVYITPEKRTDFENQVKRATKHLDVAPTISFSEPMMKRETTILNFGEDGYNKSVRLVEVIEVDIEQITSGDWTLVADVLYREGILEMVDARFYKNIPKHFGLDYAKCDYCGHTHPNRREASIVYNTKTGEWKQIGTACGKKMFRGGDLCKFFVDLYKIIDMCGGCSVEGFGGWCATLPDTAWKRAYNIDELIPAVVDYRKQFGPKWERPLYDEHGKEKVKAGTTELFKEKFVGGALNGDANMEYGKKVKAYVASLSYNMNEDGINEEGFNTKIKRAFENEYIQLFEIYTVFFAIQGYEDSLTAGDWQVLTKSLVKGEKTEILNARLVSKVCEEDYYYGGLTWWAIFEDSKGLTFKKSFSNWPSFESKFMGKNGLFNFIATVAYINNNKRFVKLGGRASKIK